MSQRTVSAEEACALLGIAPQTLYAYVARGRIRAERVPGSRKKVYLSADIERLLRRRHLRSDPGSGARDALDRGDAVLDTGLSDIRDGRLYYKGIDALELAETSTLEEVALLLWGWFTPSDPSLPPRAAAVASLLADLPPLDRMTAVVAALAADDPASWDPRPESGAAAGGRILCRLPTVATGQTRPGGVAGALCAGWGRPEAEPIVSAALVACADHELNVSAFTARCVASAGASVPDAVVAGLCALKGTRHGGQTAMAERLLDEASGIGARAAIAGRLRRGEPVPGLGHPLYPDGDPRATMLLTRVAGSRGAVVAHEVAEAAREILGELPNLDLGLAAVARGTGLPPGAGSVLFAIGRTVGWVAHALEQAASGHAIRPRARYVAR